MAGPPGRPIGPFTGPPLIVEQQYDVDAARLFNSFEGGTDSVALTQDVTGNTGGPSGDPFDLVLTQANSRILFDAPHALHGGMAVRFEATAPATNQTRVAWTTAWGTHAQGYACFYINRTVAEGNTVFRMWQDAGGTTRLVDVNIAVTGVVNLRSGALTTLASTPAGFYSFGSWMRVEVFYRAADGSAEVRLFKGGDLENPASSPTTTLSATSTIGTGISRVDFGPTSDASIAFLDYFDSLAAQTDTWVGPDATPVEQVSPAATVPLQMRGHPPLLVQQRFDAPVTDPNSITVDVPGAVTFTGQAVSIEAATTPSAGAITFTGQAQTVGPGTTPTAGAVTFTGQSVSIEAALSPAAGALTFGGSTVDASDNSSRSFAQPARLARLQRFAVGGPPLLVPQFFDAPTSGTAITVDVPGSITLTGQAVTIEVASSPTAGAITLTGQALTVGPGTTPTAGAITFTGQSVGIEAAVSPSAGAVTFAGSAVTAEDNASRGFDQPRHLPRLQPFAVGGPPLLVPQVFGPLIVSITNLVVDVAGQIALTGQAVGVSVSASPSAGAVTLTGQTIGLSVTSVPAQGQAAFTGQSLGLGVTTTPSAGALQLAGQAVGASVLAALNPGTITFSGSAGIVAGLAGGGDAIAVRAVWDPSIGRSGGWTQVMSRGAGHKPGIDASAGHRPSTTKTAAYDPSNP